MAKVRDDTLSKHPGCYTVGTQFTLFMLLMMFMLFTVVHTG